MKEKIVSFPNLMAITRLIDNAPMNFRMDDMLIEIVWLGYRCPAGRFRESNSGSHRHSFYELHLCLTGWCIYTVGDQQYRLDEGEALLLRANEQHGVVQYSKDYGKVALGFSILNGQSELSKRYRAILDQEGVVISGETEELMRLFYEVLREFSGQQMEYLTAVKAILARVIVECARLCGSREAPASDHVRRLDQRIVKINEYIHAHMGEMISCQDMADSMYMSMRQLNRIVQNEFGVSLRIYVERVKCSYAKSRLLDTDQNISAIAAELGYANEFSFSKFFKRTEGMSPATFRRSRLSRVTKERREDPNN